MKVVLSAKSIYPFHPFGGVQKYVYYFAKHLLDHDVEVEIVTPLDSGKARTEIYDGLKYTLLSPSIFWYLEYPIGWLGVHLFSRALAKYLRQIEFDLLHSFDMTGYQYLKVTDRKPVIAQIYTDNYLCNPIPLRSPLNLLNLTGTRFVEIKKSKVKISPFADRATKRQYYLQYIFKARPMYYCLSHCDAIFLEDEIFRDEIKELFRLDLSKSDVIPVGVDISFIDHLLKESTTSRADMGFSKDDVVLITVNRLAADKGVDKIIHSLAEIIKETPGVKLIIIGSGYQEKELYRIINQKGLKDHVQHFKDVPEKKLYDFLKISDIYISAFSYPGSSISTLEAMACSLPIITSGQPWLVEEGRNGVVLNDNDPIFIKDAVVALVKGNRLKDNGAISREIVQKYDWKNIVKRALENYKIILAKNV